MDLSVVLPGVALTLAVVAFLSWRTVRLRRLPSPANSMGMMKFMLPNYFGIYLHDSPEKEHFTKNELWISNGCVRVEDYKRFALNLAQRVAEAHKEGFLGLSGERVSDAEREAIEEIAAALGTASEQPAED